jgi:hypothetical protein
MVHLLETATSNFLCGWLIVGIGRAAPVRESGRSISYRAKYRLDRHRTSAAADSPMSTVYS